MDKLGVITVYDKTSGKYTSFFKFNPGIIVESDDKEGILDDLKVALSEYLSYMQEKGDFQVEEREIGQVA